MNIIILTEKDQIEDNIYKINDDRFTHIKKILKSEIGNVLEVGLLNSSKGTAKIVNITHEEIFLEISEINDKEDSIPIVDLICALPRPQTLKKVLHISAAMGVRNLYLIRSEKVEKSFFHSPILEENNYTKYLIEGLSQGKRTHLPKVTIHKKFKDFFEIQFEEININSAYILAHPETEKFMNKSHLMNKQNIVLAIGPEGGWNDYEVKVIEEKGFVKFKLSNNILRVENAVTAALAQIELLINK